MNEPPGADESSKPRHRLDPDRAAAAASGRTTPRQPPPPIDTRRYKWMIGIFGLLLVIAASVYQFARRGVGTPGVTPGNRIRAFVAPLAGSGPSLDANTRPRCDPAHPNPRALNVCGRGWIVLTFFVTGSASCVRQVDALQALSRRYSPQGVEFAAVAIRASAAQAAAQVRAHRWTIPVAYDHDGAISALYGVEICPMVELAYRDGIVADRLIGDKWTSSSALAPRVERLLKR